jgi:hypothetical protein
MQTIRNSYFILLAVFVLALVAYFDMFQISYWMANVSPAEREIALPLTKALEHAQRVRLLIVHGFFGLCIFMILVSLVLLRYKLFSSRIVLIIALIFAGLFAFVLLLAMLLNVEFAGVG